jgi:hypothetical protein
MLFRAGDVMSATSGTGSSGGNWRRLYESAVLELNPQVIGGKIDEAECAILDVLPTANESEREALRNALEVLNDLRKLYTEQRKQCKPD